MTTCDISYEYSDGIKGTLQTFHAAMLQLIEMKGNRGDAKLNFYNVMCSPTLLYACQSRVTT